ncbi:MAG: hypothetical protein J3K34DRAFT_138453 [Monoraphidium minutum]|nr:MAG: hypothetical protein J3K34DRAFT_138453 [Monoraphidium minutum]
MVCRFSARQGSTLRFHICKSYTAAVLHFFTVQYRLAVVLSALSKGLCSLAHLALCVVSRRAALGARRLCGWRCSAAASCSRVFAFSAHHDCACTATNMEPTHPFRGWRHTNSGPTRRQARGGAWGALKAPACGTAHEPACSRELRTPPF